MSSKKLSKPNVCQAPDSLYCCNSIDEKWFYFYFLATLLYMKHILEFENFLRFINRVMRTVEAAETAFSYK